MIFDAFFPAEIQILGYDEHSTIICLNSGELFFGLTNGKKPPSIALASTARLPIKIDFHRAVGGRGDLEPVLANI